MARTEHKSLAMILARELASNLATPLFIVDTAGTLVYYNEPAEAVLGVRFVEAGPLGADEWGRTMFAPEDLEGRPIPVPELPLSVALAQHRPAHRILRISGIDGVKREIEVTAFPIFARAEEFVGAVAIFWEQPNRRDG